jgi:type IV secretory pathway VirB10-like protein
MTLFVLLIVGGAAAVWFWTQGGRGLVQKAVEDVSSPLSWAQRMYDPYPPEAVPVPKAEPVKPDPNAELLRNLMQRLATLQADVNELKNKPTTTVQAASPPQPPQQKVGKKHRDMVIGKAEPPEGQPKPTKKLYTLQPGATKIPCTVENDLHSDVESIFTAKVNTAVWGGDQGAANVLLIPQGSTILGHYKSARLLPGNERLPSFTTSLAFSDGRDPVILEDGPVMDQRGRAGLVTDVNNHWWRNLGAVLIQGVLRGGAQAVQMGIASNASPPAALGSGMASTVGGYGQQVMSQWIDTRPTITVDAGERCTIIVMKPVQLPAYQS